ncbi:phospholipid phosphatase 3-like [Cimex lectularius]|uniref:Phosphatidic acid phosphatase type 2/haloperoxidase domain-containing protein n=1 Tax=Cimex lectularius TaxID=79782 RepID=A0A8I6TFH2_CIMLE|nr:phospholipid phosphatase 3-like [Cimex lectularius]
MGRVMWAVSRDVGFALLSTLFSSFITIMFRPSVLGFDCRNFSIMYPKKESTIGDTNMRIISDVFPICFIIVYELINCSLSKTARVVSKSAIVLNVLNMAAVYQTAYNTLEGIGNAIKLSAGELKPYFFEACQPDVNCSDPSINSHFVNDYHCAGDIYIVNAARMSFPSQHAYSTTMAIVYVCLFVDHKIKWEGINIGKRLFQFLLISLAMFVGLCGIVDHHHHYADVAVGFCLGTVTAFVASHATEWFDI